MIKSYISKKRLLLTLFLAVLFGCIGVCSISMATSKQCKTYTYKNGLQYKIKKSIFNETALIVDYKGNAKTISIPDKIGKYYVEEIGLDGNEIISLRKVKVYSHTKLKELCVDECDVNEIEIVSNIKHLNYFSLENSKYKKIIGLNKIKEIDYMWIERNALEGEFILNSKINKQIIANENSFRTVEINNSKGLKEINFADNKIEKLVIKNQKNIEILNLKNNKLKSIDTSKMSKLKYLNIKGNMGIKFKISKNKRLTQFVK